MVCCVDRRALCDRCVAASFAQLRGVAACRGEVWAMDVARRCRRHEPWPRGERARAIAARKVADLADDPRLRVLLADELQRWAARWWLASGAAAGKLPA